MGFPVFVHRDAPTVRALSATDGDGRLLLLPSARKDVDVTICHKGSLCVHLDILDKNLFHMSFLIYEL